MYLNNHTDEYPHTLTVERTTVILDDKTYPPKDVVTTDMHEIQGFLDTPSSSQQINYHNLDIRLDRVLYVAYGSDINRSDEFYYGTEKYEFTGDLQDQGGQHEVLSAPVRRV